MKKIYRKIKLALLCCCCVWNRSASFAQTPSYEQAYHALTTMLNAPTASLKDAVFIVENAYLDETLNKERYDAEIHKLAILSEGIRKANQLAGYSAKDKETVAKYASIFRLLTEEVPLLSHGDTLYHTPYRYDFDDIFGSKDWTQTFISKLLITHKGNCHSLPLLYKMIADEIGAETHLALAPNHIYIKQRSEKSGWFNPELTSPSFPVDAWIMASGYVHLDAVRSGLYMKVLNDKESVALCLVDLAMGYNRKYPENDSSFVLRCCNTALEYFPTYINGLLFKAKIMQQQYRSIMEAHNLTKPQDLRLVAPSASQLLAELETLYARIHELGYRQMPQKMYVDWLSSLEKEKEKYNNTTISGFRR